MKTTTHLPAGRLAAVVFLLLGHAAGLHAQTPATTVTGTLRDAQTGETLIGATVEAVGLRKGNVSNEYGFYSLTLPGSPAAASAEAGRDSASVVRDSVTLRFSYIGYEPATRRVLPAGVTIRLDVSLQPEGSVLSEVVVTANGLEERVKSTEMSVTTISTLEAKALPALFGETDIIKILQLKPGFTPGSEGTTGLYVRGGNNDQNLIVLDEAVVYNANHLFGFFSTFNSDAVKDLKVYKGGFPAQYGGRLSSVIDVRMKEGNNQKFSGSGGLGLIASRLTLEGPIRKDRSSFIVSGRRTYADIITRAINRANAGKEDYNPIPDYYFYDLNTKVNFTLSDRDRLYLSGYFGRDVFGFDNEQFDFNFNWGNATGTARWNHVFGPKLFANTTFTYSDYQYSITNDITGFSFNLGSNIHDANAKVDFYYQPTNRHTVRFGGNATYHEFEVARLKAGSDDGEINFESGLNFNGMEYAVYGGDEWALTDRLKVNYGLRLSAWQNEPAFYWAVEPRVAANFTISDDWSLKGSYARMNQYVHLLASSGLALPTDIWYPSTEGIRPEVSDQIAIGTTFRVGADVLVTWEAWYKWLYRQIDFKDGAELFGNNALENELAVGEGYAYSPIELEIEKTDGRLTGWVGYTLAWVRRGRFPEINNGAYFAPRFDTRHNVTAVALYDLSRRWQITATGVYTSGYTAWLPVGRVSFQDVPGAPIQTVVPVYGDRNTFRYPAYVRFDLGIVYKWKGRRTENDLTISIYNASDRRNPYFIYIEPDFEEIAGVRVPFAIRAQQVSLFPVLPSITWNFKF
jgi:hypothetical protein